MPNKTEDTRLERRSMQVRELRIDTRGDDDKSIIRGHAAVFNEETVIGNFFREVVKPGAFKRAIKEKQDVRALENHDEVLSHR